jgi:hypothetical protein
VPIRPIVGLPNVFAITSIHAATMKRIPRISKLFTALNAESGDVIRLSNISHSSTASRSAGARSEEGYA